MGGKFNHSKIVSRNLAGKLKIDESDCDMRPLRWVEISQAVLMVSIIIHIDTCSGKILRGKWYGQDRR
jgi:hypothetical protein